MTEREQLVQDLRAHAHEAPATCAALMRRAATLLSREDWAEQTIANGQPSYRDIPKGATCG